MRRPCPTLAALAGLLLLLMLGGCTPSKTPSQAIQPDEKAPPAAVHQGVHLASLTMMELNTDYGVALAIEPQMAVFPAGDSQFEVLNKWHGLSAGPHVERIRVLAPNGRTVVFQDETAFEITPEHLTMTVIEVIQLTAAPPGDYWIAVDLDGAEITRYTFRLVPAEAEAEGEGQ